MNIKTRKTLNDIGFGFLLFAFLLTFAALVLETILEPTLNEVVSWVLSIFIVLITGVALLAVSWIWPHE